jgi:hypothetical protein
MLKSMNNYTYSIVNIYTYIISIIIHILMVIQPLQNGIVHGMNLNILMNQLMVLHLNHF